MNLMNLIALLSASGFVVSLVGLVVLLRRQERHRAKQAELAKRLKLASFERQLQQEEIKQLQKQQK